MPEFTNSSSSQSFDCNLDRCSNFRLRNTAKWLWWTGLGGKKSSHEGTPPHWEKLKYYTAELLDMLDHKASISFMLEKTEKMMEKEEEIHTSIFWSFLGQKNRNQDNCTGFCSVQVSMSDCGCQTQPQFAHARFSLSWKLINWICSDKGAHCYFQSMNRACWSWQ